MRQLKESEFLKRKKMVELKNRTQKIFNEQEEKIEFKKAFLDEKDVVKQEKINMQTAEFYESTLRKREDKLRSIFKTLDQANYNYERRKQDALEKQIQLEEQLRRKELVDAERERQRLEGLKQREFYRDTVKKRAHDHEDLFKQATKEKLEHKVNRHPKDYRYAMLQSGHLSAR